MKTILTFILVSVSLLTFSQEKKLQEQFGFRRVHAVQSFVIDTVYNEQGQFERQAYNANMVIYREGIDGNYKVEITKAVFNDNNKTIELLATKQEYVNYIIIQ